jgi:hypothetical protein
MKKKYLKNNAIFTPCKAPLGGKLYEIRPKFGFT